jgi:hypothetical protein
VWHWLAQAVWSWATPCELVLPGSGSNQEGGLLFSVTYGSTNMYRLPVPLAIVVLAANLAWADVGVIKVTKDSIGKFDEVDLLVQTPDRNTPDQLQVWVSGPQDKTVKKLTVEYNLWSEGKRGILLSVPVEVEKAEKGPWKAMINIARVPVIGREDGLVWHWLAQAVWSWATPCELVLPGSGSNQQRNRGWR